MKTKKSAKTSNRRRKAARKSRDGVRVQCMARRLRANVIAAARRSAYEITKSHHGDESNIDDENALVEAVEALDKHEGKSKLSDRDEQPRYETDLETLS